MASLRHSALVLMLLLGIQGSQSMEVEAETVMETIDGIQFEIEQIESVVTAVKDNCAPSEDFSTCTFMVPPIETKERSYCKDKLHIKLVADETKIALRKVESDLRANCGPSDGAFSKALKIDVKFESTFRLDIHSSNKAGDLDCPLTPIPFDIMMPGGIPFKVIFTPKYRVSKEFMQYINGTLVLPVVGEASWYQGGAVVQVENPGYAQEQTLKASHELPVIGFNIKKQATLGGKSDNYDMCFSTYDLERGMQSKDFIYLEGFTKSSLPHGGQSMVGANTAYANYANKECTDEKWYNLECIREQPWELKVSQFHMGAGESFKGKVRYLPTGVKASMKVDWDKTELDMFSLAKLGQVAMEGLAVGAEVKIGIGGLPSPMAALVKPMRFQALMVNLGTVYVNSKLKVCHDGGFSAGSDIGFANGVGSDVVDERLDRLGYADPAFGMKLSYCPKESVLGLPLCGYLPCKTQFKLFVPGKTWVWSLENEN